MSENEQKGPEYPDHVRQYTELRAALGEDLVEAGVDASWSQMIEMVKKLAGYVGNAGVPELPRHIRQYTAQCDDLRAALAGVLEPGSEGEATWTFMIGTVRKLSAFWREPAQGALGEGPLVVYTIIDRERDGKKFWVRIGDGVRANGGIHVHLDALPTNGTLHVRVARRGLEGLIEGTVPVPAEQRGPLQLRAKPAARIVAWLLRKVAELGPSEAQHARQREALIAGVEALLEESER